MKDFFTLIAAGVFIILLLFGLGLALNLFNLQFLGYRTNLETHITRQTNAYLTSHQVALRTFKIQYDDLSVKEKQITDVDQLEVIHSQEHGIIKQMHEEADLIPGDVQSDIAVFLSTNN